MTAFAPADYWVEVRNTAGAVCGAGFYVTRRYVLTADHCLRRLGEQREVVLVHEGSVEAPGEVVERRKDADLALIRLVGTTLVRPPLPAECVKDDRWRTPNRPTPADPHLGGAVDETKVRFACAGGAQLEALQLRTDVMLGDYSGYSGSAVEKVGAEPALAGVLQEQVMDRGDESRGATNVLFAVTMREALETFADYFDLRPAPAPPPTTFEQCTAVLEQLADWRQRGLMSPATANMIELQVGRSLVEQFITRGSA